MKRDMDLVRKLLFEIQDCTDLMSISSGEPETMPAGYSVTQVDEHLRLLEEAGYITGEAARMLGGKDFAWMDLRLTWNGQEFAELARSDTAWRNAMQKIASTTGTVTLELLKATLETMAKAALGL